MTSVPSDKGNVPNLGRLELQQGTGAPMRELSLPLPNQQGRLYLEKGEEEMPTPECLPNALP